VKAYTDSPSQSFSLTAGVFELNSQDKSKSTGQLYPQAQLILDKEGQLQLDLAQNPWRLSDVLDWAGNRRRQLAQQLEVNLCAK